MSNYAGIEDMGSCTRDNLIAGPAMRVVGLVELAPSQTLARGTVLGKVTSSGQCVPVDKSKEDGSEEIFAVLADNVTVGDESVSAEVYFSGEFAISALTFAEGSAAEDFADQARTLGIYFRATMGA